jgi:hypothetical protein
MTMMAACHRACVCVLRMRALVLFCCVRVRSRGNTCVDAMRWSEKLPYHFNSRWLTYLTARLT